MTTESMAAPRLRAATQLRGTLQIRGTTAGNLRALLFPAEDCFANADHCFLRVRARRFRAGINNLKHAGWMLLISKTAFADWRNPLDQMIGHLRLALDTANPGCSAPLCRPIQGFLRREQFMPVVHRTHVRISRIATPLARRVCDHDFGLFADVVVRFAEGDGLPITLRHLPTV